MPGRAGVRPVRASREKGAAVPATVDVDVYSTCCVRGATSANAAWKRRSRARPRRIGYGIHALARAEGLGIDLHRARPVTTFDAHRLYQMGAEHGVGDAVLERLLRGYLCEGLNVGDPQCWSAWAPRPGSTPRVRRSGAGRRACRARARRDRRADAGARRPATGPGGPASRQVAAAARGRPACRVRRPDSRSLTGRSMRRGTVRGWTQPRARPPASGPAPDVPADAPLMRWPRY